jgi:diacylglycerol kinase (ATP)
MAERSWADREGAPGAGATAATRAPSAGWVGIAANPASGRGRSRAAVDRLADELERLGVEPRIAWSLEGRRELVESSAGPDRCRCLVAVGGDGTVAALLNERPGVPIAVVPAGTENLFARHFGFENHPRRAAQRIVGGRPSWLDLGLAGGRRFSLMAGFGFDADVVSRHHAARVGHSGILGTTHRAAYVEPVLRSSFGYRFPLLTLRTEGAEGRQETLTGTSAFVFNLPQYALGLPFAPSARGDDGWLDLVVFRDPGAFRALHYLWLVVRGLHLDRPGIAHRRVRRVAVEAADAVPVQLDGDPGGVVGPGSAEPWTVEVLPRAIEVLARIVRPAAATAR